MSVFHNNALIGASGQAVGGYAIERSLRFNSSDSAYLSRTPASAGNRKTWTWAGWVKRTNLGSRQMIFGNLNSALSLGFDVEFIANDSLDIYDYSSGYEARRNTTQVFRDCSSWYHIVIVYDSTNVTAADRLCLYVNGSRVTAFVNSIDPTLNADGRFNTAVATSIGRSGAFNSLYLNGYLADVHFIDGQALDPTSFGEFDTNGVWQPIDYTGTYGTNGFHLPFSDNSTAAALGTDTSGNSNTWTVNNISVAAGAGNDSLVDIPTSYGTGNSGGDVRGNYCTWNPLINGDTAANGNLDVTNDTARGTQKLLEYDAYWEITSTGGTTTAGVVSDGGTTNTTTVADGKTYGFKLSAAGALEYINITDGGSFTSITTGLTGIQFPYASAASSTTGSLNAGQRPFAATAPSGYKALCTTNLPEPTIADGSTVMDVALYTGNGSTQSISGLGFSPDLVWIKDRVDGTRFHTLVDSVRSNGGSGSLLELYSNATNSEAQFANRVTSLTSDGFTLGADATTGVNKLNNAHVAWTWDAGSSTVTDTQGSITSSVRANASAGFSIVTYSQGSTNATVGHGLGIAPAFIIVKSRTVSGTAWPCYHSSLGKDFPLQLSTHSAQIPASNYWGTSAPSSTVFGVGTAGSQDNNNGDMVAYCFAPVAGYSSFGSYTGNGSANGPFVYLGFRPAVVLVKMSSSTGNWTMLDYQREGYNVDNYPLYPNLANAEGTTDLIDITSNGFKVRTTDASVNTNAGTYIYAAWAQSPFALARAR